MSVAVEISNPDKALFPDGLTKAELARYYERIAETMLPHVRGRPVHMQRFPDGIEGEEIQQKQAPDYVPDFVERVRVKRKRGGSVEHVVIENAPLDRSAGFDEARAFARELAALLAEREPKRFTVEQRKEKRRSRLYLDTARNAYAQTAVAPYAVRALRDAPVACPLGGWRELGRVAPQQFTVRNIARRLARKDDPWAQIEHDARALAEPRQRLERLEERS
ncbi:MAG TPA: hypothetical protein VE596_19050 [Gaiellaceae bacterium]|jgi:DNA primase|nr:hypothetical protein [Gaiellaceae bacterium]